MSPVRISRLYQCSEKNIAVSIKKSSTTLQRRVIPKYSKKRSYSQDRHLSIQINSLAFTSLCQQNVDNTLRRHQEVKKKFHQRCLLKILRIKCQDKITILTNTTVLERGCLKSMEVFLMEIHHSRNLQMNSQSSMGIVER